MKRSFAFIIILSTLSAKIYADPLAVNPCNTVESCAVGQTCGCQVMPSSAYNRYFYVNFTGLTAKNHYQCKMAGDNYTVDFGGSTFPQGASYQCTSQNCPRFPVAFNVDTTLMANAGTNMKIRYYVPASDVTFPITFSCTKQ